MAELVTAEVRASQRPSMQPLPQVYQPALQSAERGAGTAPGHSVAAGEKGELAEYFGVSWTPEVSSRSPGGRIRRAVGRFSSVTESPMRALGPLDGPLPGTAPRVGSSPFPETPLAAHAPTWEDLHMIQTRAMLELRGIEAKVGASLACAIGNMEGLTKRKAKILARQCGSMLSGRPARERRSAKPTWSDTAARQSALREVERGIRASWTERAEQLSMDREVPTSAANFVELEALRWENRKLSDAKAVAETEVKDQARRLTQLEEMLKEVQLRPVARRRCLEGEDGGGASLERQVNSITQELQVLRAEHEADKAEVAEASAGKLAGARKVADAVAERDLARQMLKGVQAMLGHAEAARSSAQRALQQAQAEKAASQAVLAESEARRSRHLQELEGIRASREQVEAQLTAAEAKLSATQATLAQVGKSSGQSEQRGSPGADAGSHVPDMLPPPQPLAVDDGGVKAADLAASRSEAAALWQELSEAQVGLAAAAAAQQATELSAADSRRQLVSIQDLTKHLYSDIQDLKQERQAAHDREEDLRKQLQSAQAELADSRAAAGHRADALANQASAADASGAALTARVAALQQEHAQAMAAACDELVACRSAGMKAVAELEAQVDELTKDKASRQQAQHCLEVEVARLKEGISKNRAQAEEELSMAEEQIRKLKAAKQQADVASAFTEARAAKLAEELADLRAQGQSAAGQHDQHMRDVALSAARAEECQRLQDKIAVLVKERDFSVASKHAAAEAAAALETKAHATAEQHKADVKALQSQISQLKMERNMVSQAHEVLQAAHEALRAEAQSVKEVSAEQRRSAAARDQAKDAEEAAAVAQLHARMSELQARLEAAGQLKAELARSNEEADSLREQLAAASRALWTSQSMPPGASPAPAAKPAPASAVAMHQEAKTGSGKGPLRIVARLRPITRGEQASRAQHCVRAVDGHTVVLATSENAEARTLTCNRVIPPSEGQEQVFGEVRGLVSGVMNGISACVLAYGRRGSGKAHVLAGSPNEPGINFRATSQMIQLAQGNSSVRDVRMAMSVMEIHADSISDLLSAEPHRRLEVKKVDDGVCVPGLTIKQFASTADVEALMCSASAQQHAASSHLVLSVYVACKDHTTGATALGKLHLVSLAAPEEAEREGDRSLPALSTCLQAVQNNAEHVPYGKSCLTRLLADCMGYARSRVVFIATCSPTDAEGTRRTLEFCAGLSKPLAGAHEEPTGESVTSPATVAALAQQFGGSSAQKKTTQEEKLFSPKAQERSKTVRRLNMTAICTAESMAQAARQGMSPFK